MSLQQLREKQESHHLSLVARVSAAAAGLLEEGERVSFYAVAKRAEIARSTLYRCDDLRLIVMAARNAAPACADNVPPDRAIVADELGERLRQVTLERDLLLDILNEQADSSNGQSRRYAWLSLETVV